MTLPRLVCVMYVRVCPHSLDSDGTYSSIRACPRRRPLSATGKTFVSHSYSLGNIDRTPQPVGNWAVWSRMSFFLLAPASVACLPSRNGKLTLPEALVIRPVFPWARPTRQLAWKEKELFLPHSKAPAAAGLWLQLKAKQKIHPEHVSVDRFFVLFGLAIPLFLGGELKKWTEDRTRREKADSSALPFQQSQLWWTRFQPTVCVKGSDFPDGEMALIFFAFLSWWWSW